MINIFGEGKKKRKTRKESKTKRPTKAVDLAKTGQEKLERLNPMAIPLLAVKRQESPNNGFLNSSIEVISERPHRLTDKWIGSINNWVDAIVKGTLMDEPDIESGTRTDLGPFAVCKIVKANMEAAYPMPAIICVDKRGWKWYFKTSKAHSFIVGDTITFTATISAHKEGITFLRRPSKIKKVVPIMTENEEGDND